MNEESKWPCFYLIGWTSSFRSFHPLVWGKWVNALLWRCGMGGKVTWPQLCSFAVLTRLHKEGAWSLVTLFCFFFLFLPYAWLEDRRSHSNCGSRLPLLSGQLQREQLPGRARQPYQRFLSGRSAREHAESIFRGGWQLEVLNAVPLRTLHRPTVTLNLSANKVLSQFMGLQVLYSCGNSSNMQVLFFVKLMQEFYHEYCWKNNTRHVGFQITPVLTILWCFFAGFLRGRRSSGCAIRQPAQIYDFLWRTLATTTRDGVWPPDLSCCGCTVSTVSW